MSSIISTHPILLGGVCSAGGTATIRVTGSHFNPKSSNIFARELALNKVQSVSLKINIPPEAYAGSDYVLPELVIR